MGEIRRAVREDIPKLVYLAEEFALASQHVHGFSVSRFRIIEFVNFAVDSDETVVFVTVVDGVIRGFIAGTIQRIYFSEDVALQELAWYVERGFKGLGLLSAFENAAEQIGCNKVVVGNKPLYCDLTDIYLRRGYTLLENQFVKSFGGGRCQH